MILLNVIVLVSLLGCRDANIAPIILFQPPDLDLFATDPFAAFGAPMNRPAAVQPFADASLTSNQSVSSWLVLLWYSIPGKHSVKTDLFV